MDNREKNLQASKSHREEEDNEELPVKPSISPIVLNISSDDEEAKDDLSLKIVEKAMLRACTAGGQSDGVADEPKSSGGAVIDISSSPTQEAELEADAENKKNSKKKKKRKNSKVEKPDETVVVAMEEEKAETNNALEINKLVVTNAVERSDNTVLQKLLRGPRYFDPPDSGWGTCYSCGKEGHTTVNCTSAKRKRPCFVCGSLEHHAKQCSKGKDCFICKKGGHRAKDCPEKYKRGFQNSVICLKCGDSRHDMFLCKNDYSPDDLKEIRCYICKSLGHLCCADFTDNGPRELSCYRCGQLGHTGLECTRSRGEATSVGSPSSCFKCGEGGHFARECTNSTKHISSSLQECTRSRGETTSVGSLSSCFKCGEEGHFARECTNSTKQCKRSRGETTSVGSLGSCFKCGEEGHFARECINSTKECTRSRDETTSVGSLSSCFKCGEEGHFARYCTNSTKECTRSRGETTSMGSLSSCFKCGEGGHFARECSSSTKVHKRNLESSTPTQKFYKENRDYVGVGSMPSDHGKAHKNKKAQYEGGGFTTPSDSKRRGGWITEDHGDLSCGKAKGRGWGSPVTPTNKRNKTFTSIAGGHASSSRSSGKSPKLHFGTSASNGSSNFYQQRYSVSRFGNSSYDGMRRNYDWYQEPFFPFSHQGQ